MSENTTWGSINEGDVVEGSNQSLWSVMSIKTDGSITVQNVITGKMVTSTPASDKPVIRAVKATFALATARALTKVMLGGDDLGTRYRKNSLDQWICPPEYIHPGALTSHLLIWHSVFGSAVAGRSLDALEALHTAVHDPSGRGGGYTEHVHSPEYEETAK